jgi:hypothetical protein
VVQDEVGTRVTPDHDVRRVEAQGLDPGATRTFELQLQGPAAAGLKEEVHRVMLALHA